MGKLFVQFSSVKVGQSFTFPSSAVVATKIGATVAAVGVGYGNMIVVRPSEPVLAKGGK